jgi:nitrite reductase [NAD(P)H] small subunit
MVKHVRLGSISEIPKGEGRTFEIGDLRIAVFHSREGRVFATQANCPHRGGPLADGLLGGTTLICPLHEWSFDLLSGMVLNGTCGIRVYPVSQSPDGTLAIDTEEDGGPPPWRTTDYSKM